jgi:hypothetical protein
VSGQNAPSTGYTRERRLGNGLWEVTARLDEAHPDGAQVITPNRDAVVLWSSEESSTGLIRIELADFATPQAPAVWFVSVPEPRATPSATNLVAFASDHKPPGTVVTKYQFATLGVSNDEQVAAVRWYPSTGLVHQVYVSAGWRRQQLGTHVLYAADAFHQANGWPGHLHGDGRRTQLGERLVAGLRHPARFKPLEKTMPPMDA